MKIYFAIKGTAIKQCNFETICEIILPDTPYLEEASDRPAILLYVVQQGDTLWKIAKRYNAPLELLKEVKIALEELRDTVEVGSGVITSSETEDLDWINNWKNARRFYWKNWRLCKNNRNNKLVFIWNVIDKFNYNFSMA